MAMHTEELQQKYYEFQVLNEHVQKIQQQITLVKKQIEELERVDSALANALSSNKDAKMLCPLGAGIYLKTEIKDSTEVIMGVGAGICVTKSSEEAKGQVETQLKEMKDILAQLENELLVKTKELQIMQRRLQEELHSKDANSPQNE